MCLPSKKKKKAVEIHRIIQKNTPIGYYCELIIDP